MKTTVADTPSTTTTTTTAVASTQDHLDRHHHHHVNTEMLYGSPTSADLMQFLQNECPRDLVAQILTFVGPQTVQTLNRTNTFWHNFIKDESTWKTMCEGLYKVRLSGTVQTSHVVSSHQSFFNFLLQWNHSVGFLLIFFSSHLFPCMPNSRKRNYHSGRMETMFLRLGRSFIDVVLVSLSTTKLFIVLLVYSRVSSSQSSWAMLLSNKWMVATKTTNVVVVGNRVIIYSRS